MHSKVAVVGATTWGTTLGILLARNQVPVTILARSASEAAQLNCHREHRRFLPNVPFPDALTASSDVDDTIGGAELVIVAVPSHHFRRNVQWIKKSLSSEARVLSATKGLELTPCFSSNT